MRHWLAGIAFGAIVHATVTAQELQVFPPNVTLDSGRDAHRVVVLATDVEGFTRDVTAAAAWSTEPAGLVEVVDGVVHPVAPGSGRLIARIDDLCAEVAITVRDVVADPPVSFRNDVVPILTRAGCNSGACHGAKVGKNGFGLSLFGYNPGLDHEVLSREQRGRRLDCADPDASLMLAKPTGAVQHKGGVRLDVDGPLFAQLRRWIAEGANDDAGRAPAMVGLSVSPPELLLPAAGADGQVVVTATYADGTVSDVTALAILSSSSPTVATVDDAGRIAVTGGGEAFVMARFGGHAEVAQVLVVPDQRPDPASFPAPRNAIDEMVFARLRKLRVAPAPLCDDRTFARRVHLDVVGRLPSVEELARFLADESADKRERLVAELVEQPEFADQLTAEWAALLRIDRDRIELKPTFLYTRWLREAFVARVPFDDIVRELLTASGSGFTVPPANYWVTVQDPKVHAESLAQVFLGIRLQCAQCHDHPFERWRMDDYYGFAGFFAQVGRKAGEDPRETVVFDAGTGNIGNPRTAQIEPLRYLGGAAVEIPTGTDRRAALADWLLDPSNQWFARNVANRIWARLFGRGIVDPVDDVRTSNPPSHLDLHRRLGELLVESDYDLRALVRTICASHTYQAGGAPPTAPAASFAGRIPRRLSAEQMLDAIDAVTGVPTKLRGVPLGGSATRVVGDDPGNRFLDLFGRPRRDSVCACEREEEPTLNQVLHLINGQTVEDKLKATDGWLATRMAATMSADAMLDELFERAYSRLPSAAERAHLLSEAGSAADPRAYWEDVLWAVLNSTEFLFQH